MKSQVTYLFALLFGALGSTAQVFPEKGVPLLKNFIPSQYQNKGKVWDIKSAPNGVVFMAADRGLLEFDGKTWRTYKGSDGFTRSLAIINDSLIYTGSDLDFGVWTKSNHQSFEYSSLYPFRKEVQDVNEEFWDVHHVNDNILFVSSQNIYIYKNQQLTRINAPGKFNGSFLVNDSLYLADAKTGVYLFDRTSLKKIFSYPDGESFEITGIYHYNSGIVIITKNSGLYVYTSGKLSLIKNTLSELLKISKVFCFEQINNNYLAFGTVLSGLFITDLEGNIIHRINRYKGLFSNTILCLYYSNSGKLWVGTDYGVSSLHLKNNITYFYDYRGDFGTGYTALTIDDFFYLGTNQGLYQTKWSNLDNNIEFTHFQLVPGTEGQVWTLENVDNTMLIGHDHGLFALKGNRLLTLDHQNGVWTILPYRDFLLTGNYNGVSVFFRSEGTWVFLKKMDLIFGSCNQLIIENDNILWINIPNFGMIRALLDNDLYPAERLIFPENTFDGIDPCLIKDEKGIRVVTSKYHYTYNPVNKEFSKEPVMTVPQKPENVLTGIYLSAPLHPDYDFYPVYNGFALKYLHSIDKNISEKLSLIFRKIEAFNNDARMQICDGTRVPFQFNNFGFEYIVPNQNDVLYQYKLNETGKWSSWSTDNSVEFINLKKGDYTLFVKAQLDGKDAGLSSVSFYVASPWYFSWYAYVAYFILLSFSVYSIYLWQKLSLKKQKKIMLVKERNSLRLQAKKHREKIMMLEQERLKTGYDQMKQQLKNKTIELANKAKDNEDKNRLLISLKEKFDLIQDDPSTSKLRLNEIRRLLDSYLKVEDKTFEIQMDELHQEFFRTLRSRFPGLSGNDLRLCAYLKIGLSSKETAEILNILPSSVFISRSRLRKKLNLRTDEDLYSYLNSI